MFRFFGEVLPSKSWLNRAQVIQYFNPKIQLSIDTSADDVRALHAAIHAIGGTSDFDLGLGGTSFRFFAFLISRRPGEWHVRAHERLLERPQTDLISLLRQLGVHAEFKTGELLIRSEGWKISSAIEIAAESSSQFLSGLLLSSWGLEQDLTLHIRKPVVSESYLQMTIDLLRESGMQIHCEESAELMRLQIPKTQKSEVTQLHPELDVSSAFSLIAAAAVGGEAVITNWKSDSSQPDMKFIEIFRQMGVSFEIQDRRFQIKQQQNWRGIECDLSQTPDLFPVLAALCGLADGKSVLSGAEQLKHKESDRIAKTAELLAGAGLTVRGLADGMEILGRGKNQLSQNEFVFNPAHDHRMAMAAGILKLAGYNISILHPEVVNKSYPSFWRDTGVQP